jgi:hypothetical protein
MNGFFQHQFLGHFCSRQRWRRVEADAYLCRSDRAEAEQ